VPDGGSASKVRTSDKRLKVTCGNNTSYLEDSAWIGEKTPMTLCKVRISPNRTVKPNIGGLELSEALNRVLPFTAKEDNRPVLQCVLCRYPRASPWNFALRVIRYFLLLPFCFWRRHRKSRVREDVVLMRCALDKVVDCYGLETCT